MRRLMRRLTIAIGGLLLVAGAASAQEISRVEVGAAGSVLFGNRLKTKTDAGLTGRFTYNFTPSISIDAEVGGYFTNSPSSFPSYQYGGRPFLAVVGPKAGFRTRRVDFFVKARAGVLSYPETVQPVLAFPLMFGRTTHAVLDIGGVVEFRTSARTFFRVDAGTLLTRNGSATIAVTSSGPLSLVETSPGYIGSPWHFEFGMGYRVGALREDREDSPKASRFSAGGQYSLMTLVRSSFLTTRDESGVGGWFTWDFNKYIGLDSSVFFYPHNVRIADFQQGGRMLQAVAGIRAGVRRGRFGVFVKARPGIQLFTLTEQNFQEIIANKGGYTPFTDIALDLGGILEYYPSRRWMVRLDAGQTTIFYRARTTIVENEQTSFSPGFSANAIQMSLGFGFRF